MGTEATKVVENAKFKTQKLFYQKWEDFCNGGYAVESKEEYLPQHAYESQAQYAVRKMLSTYKNLARPIIAVFTSAVWRKAPVRELSKVLESFEENVDLFKTPADVFFRSIDKKAAEIGVTFVLVDSTQATDEEAVIASKSDADTNKVRPYFTELPALSVTSWGFDDEGLYYVAVEYVKTTAVDPFEEADVEEYCTVWYRDRWETYRKDDEQGLTMEEQGLHPCGEVPIVPFYFDKETEMVGNSSIADILSLLNRAYMMENAYDKSLFDTAFPQQGFYGFDPSDISSYVKASSNGLVSPNPEAHSEFIEPEGRAFSSLDAKIKSDETSIREIALRMLRPNSKVGESADAKKIDNQQLHSQLAVFSASCQSSEIKCWELAQKWLKTDTSEIEVTYHSDFDVEEISTDLIKSLSEMRRNKDLSRETFFKILQKAEVQLPEDFDITEELERIEEEARLDSAFPSLTTTNI